MAKKKQEPPKDASAANLTDEVFLQFVTALGANEEYEDVAARLKAAIFEQKSLAETAIRAALFDEDAT